ncbi:acylneuraminate cytidylyltransferase family protein [Gammaproteobacteria bacterium]|nr:acylneuraminate cytidylyltransferase family protein [Gammaproteobacteria bacterium]
MNKIFAIIPARSGSKGVKDKNIKNLCGHSLLEWSINAAIKSKLIDRVFISTDSEEYARIGIKSGAEAPFIRPDNISGDTSSDFDFVIHAINEFKKLNVCPEYIVHIRPTTPIRDPELIDEAISLFQENQEFHSLRSVHLMSESSYKTLEINDGTLTPLSLFNDERLDANAPRQSFPDTYQANGYVDVLSTKFILQNNEIHGKKILPFITEPAFELDSIEDFGYLEYLASNSKGIMNKLFK